MAVFKGTGRSRCCEEGCALYGRVKDDPEDGIGGCIVIGCTAHMPEPKVVRRAPRAQGTGYGLYSCPRFAAKEESGR